MSSMGVRSSPHRELGVARGGPCLVHEVVWRACLRDALCRGGLVCKCFKASLYVEESLCHGGCPAGSCCVAEPPCLLLPPILGAVPLKDSLEVVVVDSEGKGRGCGCRGRSRLRRGGGALPLTLLRLGWLWPLGRWSRRAALAKRPRRLVRLGPHGRWLGLGRVWRPGLWQPLVVALRLRLRPGRARRKGVWATLRLPPFPP